MRDGDKLKNTNHRVVPYWQLKQRLETKILTPCMQRYYRSRRARAIVIYTVAFSRLIEENTAPRITIKERDKIPARIGDGYFAI